jgi:TPR repeat protein
METFSTENEENTESNSRKLQAESLPKSSQVSVASEQGDNDGVLSDEQLESLLLERTDHVSRFQLGQFYFEREIYEKAIVEFEKLKDRDVQALYQLGVMYYDGLGVQENGVRFIIFMYSVLPRIRTIYIYYLISYL